MSANFLCDSLNYPCIVLIHPKSWRRNITFLMHLTQLLNPFSLPFAMNFCYSIRRRFWLKQCSSPRTAALGTEIDRASHLQHYNSESAPPSLHLKLSNVLIHVIAAIVADWNLILCFSRFNHPKKDFLGFVFKQVFQLFAE